MSRQKIDIINDIITTNKRTFTCGQTISAQQFCKLFKIPYKTGLVNKDWMKYNFDKLATQVVVNRALEKRGLYLRSRNYYDYYEVVEAKVVPRIVDSLDKQAKYKTVSSNNLSLGHQLFNSKWKRLNKADKDAVYIRTKNVTERLYV